ncbi:MAG: tetratricopeptide repeat protein [Armatimonadota bacterium]
MMIPARSGLEDKRWQRTVAERDRARDNQLRKLDDLTNSGGVVIVWERAGSRLQSHMLLVQPGIADDLLSLLSSLAAEIAWPGVPEVAEQASQVVAAWARIWQVRDAMDLRVALHWDAEGHFHAVAGLRAPDGVEKPLLDTEGVVELLNRTAVTPESSQSPHGLLVAGNRALEAGDFPAAREAYLRALKDLPRHPEAHRNLALALARLDEWEAAATAMREAWELAPDDHGLRAEYLALESDAGVEAVRQNDLARAADHFLRILDRWPDEPTALANLGNIRLREGRLPEARAIYRRFLRHHPDHPAAAKIELALAEIGEEE